MTSPGLGALGSGSKVWDKIEYGGRQQELDGHVHAGCKEWEMEVEIFLREHPFIILQRLSALDTILLG